MIMVLTLIMFVLTCGYLNQHRGGGPFRLNSFLKDKMGFDLGRSIFTATLMLIGSLFTLTTIFPQLTWLWVLGTAVTWLLWGINGWGSYFDNGNTETEYNDKPEVPWIDWVLYLIFGPKWNPIQSTKPNRDKIKWDISEHGLPFPLAFGFLPPDLIKSPTGAVRPFKWRRLRDTVGLFLRHCHSILFFAFQAWWFSNPSLLALTLPFAGLVTLTYFIFNIKSVETYIQTKMPVLFAGKKYLEFKNDPNSYAETIAGLIWGIIFVLIFSINIL